MVGVISLDRLKFEKDGYLVLRSCFRGDTLRMFSAEFSDNLVGERKFAFPDFFERLGISSRIRGSVEEITGKSTKPVRLIFFDKTPKANWSLGWHQDRTIAVKKRETVAGFDVWSKKAGVPHVEPPFDMIENSVTIRISVDHSSQQNGALEVIPGSHRRGKLTDSEVNVFAAEGNSAILDTEPGDVVLLSTPILHRSGPNKNGERRRTVQIDYSWADLPSPLEWAFKE